MKPLMIKEKLKSPWFLFGLGFFFGAAMLFCLVLGDLKENKNLQEQLFVALSKAPTPNNHRRCSLEFNKGLVLQDVLLAETKAQQARGLTGKTSIPTGMLFSFQKEGNLMFWMKDTPMDLSVGFFDSQGLLFKIKDMQANSTNYHFSLKKALNALELEQGEFQKLGLSVGSVLINRQCSKP